jgi:hypothetical protein
MNVTYVLDFSLLKHFSLRGMFSDNGRVTNNMCAEGHTILHVQSTSNMCAGRHTNLHVQSSLFLSNTVHNFKALTDVGKTIHCHMPCNRSSDSVAAKRTT